MSEVDRLSNSGLYPALPIADKNSRRDGSSQQPPSDKRPSATPSAGESRTRNRRGRRNHSSTIMPSMLDAAGRGRRGRQLRDPAGAVPIPRSQT